MSKEMLDGESREKIISVKGLKKAYKLYKSVHKRKAVKDFKVYVKPAEGAAYYTVNGEGSEEFRIEL